MKILALELSSSRGSLTWSEGGRTAIRTDEWPNDRKDSGPFFENLQSSIQEFGSPATIIVGLGPGSYAGVRIAISAAIGLGAAAPESVLLGYPSVCAFKDNSDDYVIVSDARRRSFLFVRIANRTVVGDYELLAEDELRSRLDGLPAELPVFSSDLSAQFHDRIERRHPSAEILAQLAAENQRSFIHPPLEPIYLRDAHVTVAKPIVSRTNR